MRIEEMAVGSVSPALKTGMMMSTAVILSEELKTGCRLESLQDWTAYVSFPRIPVLRG